MKPLNLYGSVCAQVQVKQTIISSVYIKELQERSRKETELEIKESSIISNRLHYTKPDYICYIYALRQGTQSTTLTRDTEKYCEQIIVTARL